MEKGGREREGGSDRGDYTAGTGESSEFYSYREK